MDATELESFVRAGYEAFNRNDLDAIVADFDPEIEWYEPREVPGLRVYQGQERVRRYLEGLSELWDDFRVVPEELFVLDEERVLVLAQLSARGRESGAPVKAGVAHLWTIRGGRATSVRVFLDRVDALREAGLA